MDNVKLMDVHLATKYKPNIEFVEELTSELDNTQLRILQKLINRIIRQRERKI